MPKYMTKCANQLKIINMRNAVKQLTGARDNALNINKAPNISIRKPIKQALLKAHDPITYKHKSHLQPCYHLKTTHIALSCSITITKFQKHIEKTNNKDGIWKLNSWFLLFANLLNHAIPISPRNKINPLTSFYHW